MEVLEMGMDFTCGRESLNPKHIISYFKYKFKFRVDHPDYFDPDGLLCFIGPQGSGKTLSAVNYTYKLLEQNPYSKICTNLLLREYPVVTFEEFKEKKEEHIKFLINIGTKKDLIEQAIYELYLNENRVFPFNDNDDFKKYDNGEKGMIFLVDEISLYLNSLESKNINMDVVTEISQQRKQRKHIVTTSQVFGRMAKPLREQFSNVVVCKNFLGFIQKNSLVDRDSLETESSSDTNITGTVKKVFIWLHQPKFYGRYDTYYKIIRGKFVAGEKQKEGMYKNDYSIKLSGDN
jgi:hypothetical protein